MTSQCANCSHQSNDRQGRVSRFRNRAGERGQLRKLQQRHLQFVNANEWRHDLHESGYVVKVHNSVPAQFSQTLFELSSDDGLDVHVTVIGGRYVKIEKILKLVSQRRDKRVYVAGIWLAVVVHVRDVGTERYRRQAVDVVELGAISLRR